MSKVEGFDDLTGGQLKALCIKLGGMDIVNAILRDEITVEVKEMIKKLFDRNGRRIPPDGMKSSVCDPNASFKLTQPKIDYATRLARLVNYFPTGTIFLSTEEFQAQSEELIEQLKQDNLLSNLLKGVHLPVCFPQFVVDDYGKGMDSVFLPAVGKSYEEQFPGRKFYNYRKGELEKKISIIEGSRHDKFIDKMTKGSFAGIQFFPLQGFSINANREQMKALPQSILLSGGIDIATAMVAYPDVLARDYNTPGYDCAALSWRSAGGSLFFGAYGDELVFGACGYLGPANDSYSGGLLFLG
ncbi:MAG: hypothetical protein V1892_01125 [bacterium]